jgi:hypothetical protein
MLRKRPFTDEEADFVILWPLAQPLIVARRHAVEPYNELFSGRKTLAQVIEESPQRVGPVFDDSPFYFATERPWGMPTQMRQGIGVLLIPVIVLLTLFVAFGKPKGKPVRPYAASVVYFCCLGAGFIAVELTLLQHLTLLFGHPTFTLSLLLFTILAAGGAGSALSGRVQARWVCFAIAALGIVGAFVLPKLVATLLPLGLPQRVAIAVVLIIPFGLMMGMPFPKGLQRTGQGSLPPAPFYWGLNGIMSVIGSVGTVVLALLFGFQAAMLAGSGCYVLAALTAGNDNAETVH